MNNHEHTEYTECWSRIAFTVRQRTVFLEGPGPHDHRHQSEPPHKHVKMKARHGTDLQNGLSEEHGKLGYLQHFRISPGGCSNHGLWGASYAIGNSWQHNKKGASRTQKMPHGPPWPAVAHLHGFWWISSVLKQHFDGVNVARPKTRTASGCKTNAQLQNYSVTTSFWFMPLKQK